MEEENEKKLLIRVTEDNWYIETEMDPTETVFWLEAAKTTITSQVLSKNEE